MANRLFNPDEQYCDQNGVPYAGGSLAFFASGTSSPLVTYSDSALTIPNSNPVTLDSAGRAGSIFLQNLAYKVVLSDVNNNIIWTEDPVYSSDFSTIAQFQTYPGNPNGHVAGTAGSGTIPSSVVWDTVDNILYICTTTGNSATAVWTAVNTSPTTPTIPAPTGYLTPVSATPVITSDVLNNTSFVYTPYTGNNIPIYNGTAFNIFNFAELTMPLVSAHSQGTIYDVFVFNNSGVITLVTGPAWSNSSPGTCARGSATALTRINGIWVNNISITGRNGNTTYSIGANQATYVGSVIINGSAAGQITCHRSYGQNRVWAMWNCYNRIPIFLKAGDPTASWSYNGSNRASNNNASNRLTTFVGLQEEISEIKFVQFAETAGSSNSNQPAPGIAIGINSFTVGSGKGGTNTVSNAAATTVFIGSDLVANFTTLIPLGITNVQCLESGSGVALNAAFFGTEGSMLMSAIWRG